jgi:hypothetical protein
MLKPGYKGNYGVDRAGRLFLDERHTPLFGKEPATTFQSLRARALGG